MSQQSRDDSSLWGEIVEYYRAHNRRVGNAQKYHLKQQRHIKDIYDEEIADAINARTDCILRSILVHPKARVYGKLFLREHSAISHTAIFTASDRFVDHINISYVRDEGGVIVIEVHERDIYRVNVGPSDEIIRVWLANDRAYTHAET
jgi:hypothetical protein